MPTRARYKNRIELLQGTLDLLILQTLQWGPQHGYAIAQAIRIDSSEALQVDTGSLYPALHRLERQKLIGAILEGVGQPAADARLPVDPERARAAALRAIPLEQIRRCRRRHPQ